MITLFVVQSASYGGKSYGGDGVYCLVLPKLIKEKKSTLWSHMCSNANFAMSDLQYPKRKIFLDAFFGEGKWQFKQDLEGNILDDPDWDEDKDIDCDKLVAAMDAHFGGDNHAKVEIIMDGDE